MSKKFVIVLATFVSMSVLASKSLAAELRIAAFNIQAFGQTKASNDDVMEILAYTISEYDIIFIQEIRDSLSGEVIERLVNLSETRSARDYDYVLSHKIGRNSYKEQYAYVYRRDKVELLSSWVYDDRNDKFAREPYIASFQVGNEKINLIGLHTQPDEAYNEIRAVRAVEEEVRLETSEPNSLLLGDLNADCNYYNTDAKPLSQLFSGARVWIEDWEDTTVANTHCAYDRIISFGSITDDLRSPEVLRFEEFFGINQDKARTISDHYPVSISLDLRSSLPQPEKPKPELPASCGLNPYLTPKNYCYAEKDGTKKRVAMSCCNL